MAALATLAASACSDADPTHVRVPRDFQAPLAVAAESGLRDVGISRGDTYFAFSVTTEQGPDDGSTGGGAGLVSTANYTPNEAVYIETGYGDDGQLRFSLYSGGDDNPRLPDPPAVVRTVGNSVSMYDQWGSLLDAYTFNDYLDGAGLPGGDLSVGSPRGSIYDPGGGTCLQEPCPTNPMSVAAASAEVRQEGEDVLVITTRMRGGDVGLQAASADQDGVTVRRYRKRSVPTTGPDGGRPERTGSSARWVIESIERTGTHPTPKGPVRMRTRNTFRFAAAHVNPGRDRQREKRLAEPPVRKPRPTEMAARMGGAQAVGGVQAATTYYEPGINLCDRKEFNYARTVYPGGASLVYQHGFCSGADTWIGMRERIPESHFVGVEQGYSLNPDQRIDDQTNDLEARLSAQGVGGNVVVSHSQGGLIARRLGQRRPDLVSGLVTIGTPHEGALIAGNAANVVSEQLRDAIGWNCFGNIMCQLREAVLQGATARLLNYGADAAVPLVGDVRPGSELLASLNGRSEYRYETFRRASITNIVPVRFALFRLLGDAGSPRERLYSESPLGGQGAVRDAHRVYNAGRLLQHLAMSLRWHAADYGYGWGCHQSGYRSYWEPCYDQGYYYRWWQASYWYRVADILDWVGGAVVNTLDYVDYTWDQFTTGGWDDSDGFIQAASQPYPEDVGGAFPPKRFGIATPEAHTGETASPGVLRALRIALDEVGMPRR
jgi:pimeloyl-ACP methyl ester carboxylesterase